MTEIIRNEIENKTIKSKMEELLKKVEQLELKLAEKSNGKTKKTPEKTEKPRMKVGEKGGLSVYGHGRFPITHPANVWKCLLNDKRQEILDFLEEHKDELTAVGVIDNVD